MKRAIISIFLILSIVSSNLRIGDGQKILDVINFGAVGDGKTDDSPAFLKAWKALCSKTRETATLVIPASRTFLLSQVDFFGPCNSTMPHIQVLGKIVAPKAEAWTKKYGCWICFMEVSCLVLDGSGQIDGNGATWWNKSWRRPTALHFHRCDNLKLNGLTHLNSQMNHITVFSSNRVSMSNLHITAPANSPNTDGIDIGESTQVVISNSYIGTGDDCIAIKGGSSNINITNVTCGPGHGISIGSLGEGGAYEIVEEVHVSECTFTASSIGARIKTVPGGSGYVRKVSFEHITLIGPGNAIEIDQHYCNGREHSCLDSGKAVVIDGVTYTGFYGTTAGGKAIYLDCSSKGCGGITINHLNITSSVHGQELQTICKYAHGRAASNVPVVSCLIP